jgi:hypothetical protein
VHRVSLLYKYNIESFDKSTLTAAQK